MQSHFVPAAGAGIDWQPSLVSTPLGRLVPAAAVVDPQPSPLPTPLGRLVPAAAGCRQALATPAVTQALSSPALASSSHTVARGVGQSNLLTLPSASTCHAGPKLQVTVWQGVMTKLIIRMALVKRGGTIYRPAGGSFLGRSTGRWYPLGVSGCAAGWQRNMPAPARGRRRHLGAGCYTHPHPHRALPAPSRAHRSPRPSRTLPSAHRSPIHLDIGPFSGRWRARMLVDNHW